MAIFIFSGAYLNYIKSIPAVIGHLFIIGLCIKQLTSLVYETEKVITQKYIFWISFALLLYFSGNVLLAIVSILFESSDPILPM